MSNAEISFGRVKMQLKIGAIMMLATVIIILLTKVIKKQRGP